MDEELWHATGVVYARMYRGNPVYIGSTDGVLGNRILRHIKHLHEYSGGKAAEYRRWAKGRRITIVAYHPPLVNLLGRQIAVHRALEVALIREFKPRFVSRC